MRPRSTAAATAPADARPSDVKKQDKKPEETKSAGTLIEEYLGSRLAMWSDQNAAGSPMTLQATAIETMIVTLPDPRASRFASSFDDRLGGVQRAAEISGYQLDRFSLPWTPDGSDASDTPGVFLFRHSEEAKLLVVWIVGETPTTGVHKSALAKALSEASAFHVPQPPSDSAACVGPLPKGVSLTAAAAPRDLRVLAPTFSGSWRSLDQTLHIWAACIERTTKARPGLRVLSGSATAIPPAQPGVFQVAGTRFQATVLRDSDSLNALLEHLCSEQRIPPARVALLVEANTAYGQAVSRNTQRPCGEPGRTRVVRFPLHIAQLRQGSQSDAARTDASTAPAVSSQSLTHVTLDAERDTLETPASQSRQTEAAVDVELAAALRSLAQSAVAYVGILASDIQDTIVLAREVRKHAPNATLFTLSNDVLFLHPDVNRSLLGTLIVSTYPLVPKARRVYADGGYVPFATDRDVGVYNAFLALMGKDEFIEYGIPPGNDPSIPGYWMSVVGRDAFWPIRPLNGAPTPGYYYERAAGPPSAPLSVDSPIPPRFQIVYLGWCTSCLLLMYAMGLTRKGLSASHGTLRVLTGRARVARYLHLVATCTTLLVMHVLLTAIFVVPLNVALFAGTVVPEPTAGWSVLRVAGVLAMIVLGVALTYALVQSSSHVWQQRRHFPRDAFGSVAVIIGASIGAIGIAAGLAWRWLGSSAIEQVLLASRAAAWMSGVSPLLPLILIGFAGLCCTIGTLRRLRLCDELIPIVTHGDSSFAGIEQSEKRVQRAFVCETSAIPGFFLVAAGLAVPCTALLMTRFAPPAEERPFWWLFALGFVVIYFGLIMEFARFVYGWSEVRGYLRRLAWHPTSVMFGSLNEPESPVPSISLTHSSHVMTALSFVILRGRRFVDVTAAAVAQLPARTTCDRIGLMAAGLREQQQQAEQALARAVAHDALGETHDAVKERRKAHREVSTLVSDVMKALDGEWPHLPRPSDKPVALDSRALQAGALLVTARAVAVLHFAFLHLQNLIVFVTSGLLLMLFAVTLYPFQPHGWLLVFNWALVTLVIVSALSVFVQMDRDRVMSLLTATTPGHVTFDKEFFLRIFLFAVVPVLGLLGANFPDSLRQALDWFKGGGN